MKYIAIKFTPPGTRQKTFSNMPRMTARSIRTAHAPLTCLHVGLQPPRMRVKRHDENENRRADTWHATCHLWIVSEAPGDNCVRL